MQDNDHNNKSEKKDNPLNSSYARFSGMAVQMIAVIAVGTFIGVKLDEKFPNEHNLYTIGLSLASVIGSMVLVISQIISNSKKDNQD
jgi:F0F1-type ATP synthase assembly protein I